jgi:hypothetical protein
VGKIFKFKLKMGNNQKQTKENKNM